MLSGHCWQLIAANLLLVQCASCAGPSPAAARPGFGFNEVRHLAAQQAKEPYRATNNDLPAALERLDYDGYKAINYRGNRAMWNGTSLPFRVEFFHRGYLYRDHVDVFTVKGMDARPVRFHPDSFEYSRGRPRGLATVQGFAGLRAYHQISKPEGFGEVVSFLGASYFRATGRRCVYGASARGLAIDMAIFDRDEEFPVFRKFWIVRPQRKDAVLTLYALLDSPSAAGAYRFDIQPAEQATIVDVRASLFLRKPVSKLGLAPLTSMFLYGEGEIAVPAKRDHRPEVHDSDGMLLATADGEWLWRPLHNPRQHRLSIFRVETVKGFGLLQRDRDAGHYEDPRTSPHQRPSIWVEPLGKWGPGRIELLELASDGEGMDNIGAQYVPDAVPAPGTEIELNYRLHFSSHRKPMHAGLRVVETRRSALASGHVAYELQFAGELPDRSAAAGGTEPIVTATGGTVHRPTLRKESQTGSWHLSFEVSPADPSRHIDLRAYLRAGADALSETWTDTFYP